MYYRFFTAFKVLFFSVAFILTVNIAQGQCVNTDSTITASVCNGDTFYVGTIAHTQSNTYTDTINNAGGCDSIVTLNLTVIAPIRQTVNDTICLGATAYFNGMAYTTSGSHKDTLVSAVTGCDSITTFNLIVRSILTGTVSQSICRGGSYDFNGNTLNTPGVYKDTLSNAHGCDSVVTLTLSYSGDVPHNVSVSICAGNSYVFNGATLIYSGVYNDTLVASTGCDSLVVLTLDILPNPLEPYIVVSGNELVASDAPFYQWLLNGSAVSGDTDGNITITQGGNYQVQVTGPNGCKSISANYNEYPTGINSIASGWNVSLYPNPNNGLFEIVFTDNIARTVQITDALGRVILADESVSGTKEFNLNGLAGGVYFTRIKQQDEVKTIRFVVAK